MGVERYQALKALAVKHGGKASQRPYQRGAIGLVIPTVTFDLGSLGTNHRASKAFAAELKELGH